MKRFAAAGICVIAMIAAGAAIVAIISGGSGGFGLTSKASANPLFALEIATLTRDGIPAARAAQAIDVQDQVAETGLPGKIEAALGAAYAGAWFDSATAQLHVGVTSPASRRRIARILAPSGLTAHVVTTPVRSTWSDLVAAQSRWHRRLARLFARSAVVTGLTARGNLLDIALSSSVSRRERAAIAREAAASSVNISVTTTPASQLIAVPESSATKCNAFQSGAARCESPLNSGVSIDTPPLGTRGFCTAGPMAIPRTAASKGETYVLTAGHCMASFGGVGAKWYAWNRAGQTKEIGVAAEFVRNTKGDVGAIRISNPGYWVTTKTKDPVFAETAEWSVKNPEATYPVVGQRAPMQGAMTCVEGQTTGQSCGIIGTTSIEWEFEDKETGEKWKPKGLVEENGALTLGGDSGGPFMFIRSDKSVLMEGTLVGGPSGGTKDFYEPLSKAFSVLPGLNLELLTKGNEVRP